MSKFIPMEEFKTVVEHAPLVSIDLINILKGKTRHEKCNLIDVSKLKNKLLWSIDENFDREMVKTIDVYLNKFGVYK